ncbi:hypothetical protein L2E82_39659 [Cichorium intybus]|uniref:Uncharacterized protein n=1 Tax=Cichorium intybus TaxID=13427 RepID=A0ACB9AJG3_CICIN|nr:hypothetical protein L2E82_39659 [Cichorium intybus]
MIRVTASVFALTFIVSHSHRFYTFLFDFSDSTSSTPIKTTATAYASASSSAAESISPPISIFVSVCSVVIPTAIRDHRFLLVPPSARRLSVDSDTINALDFGTAISKPLMDEESDFTGPLFPQFQIRLTKDDFVQAMKGFLPIAMCDITKSASEEGHGGWQDVADLIEIRNSIKEMIELPSKFPMIFSHGPLRLTSNVLLYGPPGCDKTHIVGASAAACSLRFISVKGPVLLNKYIGASEQVVRDIFSKAAATAPWLLFFDEFDSIAPKKGS